jgi:hypothetical protein
LDEPERKSMEWTDETEWVGVKIGQAAPRRETHEHGAARGLPAPGRGFKGKLRNFAWLVLAAGAALGSASCSKSGSGEPVNAPEMLDRWQGPLAALFDDSIHPAAVGMSLEGSRAQDDPMIRSRCATADLVARLQVNTVNRQTVGAKVTYHLILLVGTPTLLPSKLREKTVELVIHQDSAAFGIVSAVEGSLKEKTFIAFLKRFAGDHGPELHWVLTADTPEVAAQISTASLGEGAGQ